MSIRVAINARNQKQFWEELDTEPNGKLFVSCAEMDIAILPLRRG